MPQAEPVQNTILLSLDGEERESIFNHLEQIPLPAGRMLAKKGRPIEHVYFLDAGVACVVAESQGAQGVDVAMIGPEGFTGIDVALGGSRAFCESLIRIPGRGHRMRADVFQGLLSEHTMLRTNVFQFVSVFIQQIVSTASASARMSLDERLARLLLMLHDRVGGDEVKLTHDRLAASLGVRRAGVSIAAKKLDLSGAIATHRGAISILDRDLLKESCGDGYRALAPSSG